MINPLVSELQRELNVPAEHAYLPIGWEQADLLISLLNEHPGKELQTLEIGLGLGVSAAAILKTRRSKRHVVISQDDPARQRIGLENAHRFDDGNLCFLEGNSHFLLPTLVRDGEKFDVVLIDGGHRFDDAFVDFHFVRHLTKPGSVVLIDDLWMPSLKALKSWIETNLDEWERVPNVTKQFEVLRKTAQDDDRASDHFVPFETAWKAGYRDRGIRRWLRALLSQ